MKIINLSLTIIVLFALSALATINIKAQSSNSGMVFTVNHNEDSADINHGNGVCADANGQCTLRAAIQEANALTGNDIIIFSLPTPSTINLTLGELRITSSVSVVGPGPKRLTIQRSFSPNTSDFEIFNIARKGIYSATIRGLTIKNGKGYGAGIYVDYACTAYLTEIVVSNNSGGIGGGIGNAGTVFLTRSLLDSNVTTHQGGGFINLGYSSVATITNSTITNNSSGMGGGIYNNGKLLLVNNTISHNSATEDGSSIANALDPGATVSVLNTIVGSNNSLTINSLSGPFNSLGNNIVTDARGSTGFTNGVNNDQVSDNNIINPLLGNLADNGGQTGTRALQTGSPAINAGNNCVRNGNCSLPPNTPLFRLLSDQRTSHNRLVGGAVDVGAFEAGASVPIASISFGTFILSPSGRFAGAIAVLTGVSTNEKFYTPINPFGNFSFRNLKLGEVYILEIRSKRAAGFPPRILDFDNIPFGLPFRVDNLEGLVVLEGK